jgi:hypothetical protein
VPARAVRDRLRRAFRQWGRPGRLRVDNGVPWGSKGDLPTDLALWLLGCDVGVWWNPPRQPRRNAVVERCQGVAQTWAEPQTCASAAELQRRLDRLDRLQREDYPAVGGRSRLEAYPDLAHSGREDGPGWERRHWSLDSVLSQLAGYTVPRRVDRKGMVSVYNRNHYVGVAYRGRTVYVRLDPKARAWVFADEHGRQLRERPATELTRRRILALAVSHRRRRRSGPT